MKKLKFSIILLPFFVLSCTQVSPEEGSDNQIQAEISASPENIEYNPSDANANVIEVVSSVSWKAELSDNDLKISKLSGSSGTETIKIVSIPEGKTATVTFTTRKRSESDTQASARVTVTRKAASDNPDPNPDPNPQPGDETVIYYENFDKDPGTSMWIDQSTAFANPVGTGAANVTYTGGNAGARNSYQSSGYPGFSAQAGIYFSTDQGWMQVSGISLPSDNSTFKLTAGLYNYNGAVDPSSTFSVEVLNESGKSQKLTYTVQKYGSWYLGTSVFKIDGAVPSRISIKVSGIKSARMDDLKLVTTSEIPTCTISFGSASTSYSWAEMPQTVRSSSDYKYVTHRGTTYSSKKSVRNYSACYDTRRHNPMWVAYPCHEIYWEGDYTRPKPDPWRPDPQFEQSEQSIIYATDWKNWPWEESENKPTDNYYYWTPLGVNDNNKSVTVGKGHLMRSAERGAKVPNVLFGLNEQTFYPTNISPERNRYAAHWSAVEYLLPNNWRCNDTVYVVAGCFYENEKTILYDASNWNKHSALSKPCVMPTAKYKVFLRTKSGITGKNIAECSADELMAIGFWFPQEHDPKVEVDEDKVTAPSLSTVIYSVADIERMIGGEFKFFPTAPEAVKKSYNIDDWPGLRAKL